MNIDRFSASTQYNDLRGTVAADWADTDSIAAWLGQHGLTQQGEYLLGISAGMCSDELFVFVSFFFALNETNLKVRIPGVAEAPTIVVRRIQKEVPLRDFFSFFKRLEFTLSSDGEFEDHAYTSI
jgi:hypothetical protein